MAAHGRHAHADESEAPRSVGCALLTISDTRAEETDASAAKLRAPLGAAGHDVRAYRIVRDDPGLIQEILRPLVADPTIQAVFLTGGTGLAPRDTTFEAIRGLFEKEI